MPSLNIRTTDEVKEKLKAIAEYDNRSMSKEIEHLIKLRYEEIIRSKK